MVHFLNCRSRTSGNSFSGQFTQVDRDAKFLEEEEEVDGVSLVEDLDLVKQIHSILCQYTHGPTNWFPVAVGPSLSTSPISICWKRKRTSWCPGLVACDPICSTSTSEGEVCLEGQTQNIFYIQPSHAIRLPSSDGRFIKDTVLDGHFFRPSRQDNQLPTGRLTFSI